MRATLKAKLDLEVNGNGHVVLDGARSCDAQCSFSIATGVTHRLVAVPDGDKPFTGWMGACGGSGGGGGHKDPGTPAGNYTVTVNATTGGASPLTGSTSFALVVQ